MLLFRLTTMLKSLDFNQHSLLPHVLEKQNHEMPLNAEKTLFILSSSRSTEQKFKKKNGDNDDNDEKSYKQQNRVKVEAETFGDISLNSLN
jgi:hypothetical protein